MWVLVCISCVWEQKEGILPIRVVSVVHCFFFFFFFFFMFTCYRCVIAHNVSTVVDQVFQYRVVDMTMVVLAYHLFCWILPLILAAIPLLTHSYGFDGFRCTRSLNPRWVTSSIPVYLFQFFILCHRPNAVDFGADRTSHNLHLVIVLLTLLTAVVLKEAPLLYYSLVGFSLLLFTSPSFWYADLRSPMLTLCVGQICSHNQSNMRIFQQSEAFTFQKRSAASCAITTCTPLFFYPLRPYFFFVWMNRRLHVHGQCTSVSFDSGGVWHRWWVGSMVYAGWRWGVLASIVLLTLMPAVALIIFLGAPYNVEL